MKHQGLGRSYGKLICVAVLMLACTHSYAGVTYKIEGTCKYSDRNVVFTDPKGNSITIHAAAAGPVAMPEGIVIEVRGEESLAADPVLATMRVGANGQFQAEWTENDTTAPNLYLKVFLQTKKADGTQKIFFSGHGDGDYVHHFWTSKTFLAGFKLASVADGHTYGLNVNLEFGTNILLS